MVLVRTDGELLAAVADGDRAALRELHDRHAPWVLARLRRRCADPDVAAEAVQDTFVAVWKAAAKWDGRGEPAAWIWGIAIRRLIGVLRTRGRWTPVAEASRAPARGGPGHRRRGAGPHRHRARRTGRGDGRALARAARRAAGHGARRPHHARGRAPARHPGGHRQDPRHARSNRAPRSTGMNTTWHAPSDTLARFARRPESLDEVTASSIEQHLIGCPECRAAVAGAADPMLLRHSWDEVADVIDRPAHTLTERVLERVRHAERSGPGHRRHARDATGLAGHRDGARRRGRAGRPRARRRLAVPRRRTAPPARIGAARVAPHGGAGRRGRRRHAGVRCAAGDPPHLGHPRPDLRRAGRRRDRLCRISTKALAGSSPASRSAPPPHPRRPTSGPSCPSPRWPPRGSRS